MLGARFVGEIYADGKRLTDPNGWLTGVSEERGYFEVTRGTRSGKGGVMHTTRTTKVTQRGCQYFINKYIH